MKHRKTSNKKWREAGSEPAAEARESRSLERAEGLRAAARERRRSAEEGCMAMSTPFLFFFGKRSFVEWVAGIYRGRPKPEVSNKVECVEDGSRPFLMPAGADVLTANAAADVGGGGGCFRVSQKPDTDSFLLMIICRSDGCRVRISNRSSITFVTKFNN